MGLLWEDGCGLGFLECCSDVYRGWLGSDDVAHVLTAGDLGGSGSHDGAAESQVFWNVNAEAAGSTGHGADRESFLVIDDCLHGR